MRCCVCGLRVELKVMLYELATPATAISQPRATKQAQEKGCAESVEDRKKAERVCRRIAGMACSHRSADLIQTFVFLLRRKGWISFVC